MIRCSDCGGFGLNLVRVKGRCCHCVRVENGRKTKSRFIEKQLQDGYVDMSELGDCSLLKKTIQPGEEKYGLPEKGCPVKAHFVGRIWDEETESWDSIFETSRDQVDGKNAGGTDDPIDVHIGRYNKDAVEDDLRKEIFDPMHVAVGRCEAWDQALLSMRRNEIARFVCSPELAYGSAGYPPKVEPNSYVMFEFELLSWERSLPCLPSREEMERSRLEREMEEAKKLEEHPPPTIAERVALSHKDRESGNEAFKTGDFAAARKFYDGAFSYIYLSENDYNFAISEEEREMIDECKILLHSNRALCKMKLGMFPEALWDCTKVLDLDPTNEKALFRRCSVRAELLKAEMRKEDENEFWVLEKAWEILKAAREDFKLLVETQKEHGKKLDKATIGARDTLLKLEEKLKSYTKEYRKQEKNLFQKKIWGKVQRENEQEMHQQACEEVRKQQEEQQQLFQDMPALDEE